MGIEMKVDQNQPLWKKREKRSRSERKDSNDQKQCTYQHNGTRFALQREKINLS